jgi:hypothetical protein
MAKRSRLEVLKDLVELRAPVNETRAQLAEFDWHSELELITMTTHDLARALTRFEAGSLDETDLSDWAEALQGREDVALDPPTRELLSEALYELSTPELFGPMSEVVNTVRSRLT